MLSKFSVLFVVGVILIVLIIVIPQNTDCSGNAMCLKGKISNIVDGDTIDVDDIRVRLSLTSTPEIDSKGGIDAKKFVEDTCPVGSDVLVDEDDGQIEGSYGRIIAKVFCQGIVLNEEILKEGYGEISTIHCIQSEFNVEPWAKTFGC